MSDLEGNNRNQRFEIYTTRQFGDKITVFRCCITFRLED